MGDLFAFVVRRLLVFIALFVPLGGLVSCARTSDPDSFVTQHTDELEGRTVPPSASALTRSGPYRNNMSATANWEFDIGWEPQHYTEWVISKLRPTFQTTKVSASQLAFARHFQGDVEELHIEMSANAAKLHVRVSLETYPD